MKTRLKRWGPLVLVAGAALAGAACNPRVEEYEERGDQYSAQGRYADAQAEYELALQSISGEAPSRLTMKAGALALRAKDFTHAGTVFDQLLKQHPARRDEVAALYHLYARRWEALGDTFAALQAIDWLLARDSTANLGTLYFTLGDAAFARPDYDEAIRQYLLGIARSGDDVPPDVYARLGSSYERERNCPQAIPYFRRYLASQPSDEESLRDVRFRLGGCAYRMAERSFAAENWDQAEEYARLTIETGEPVSRTDDATLILARVAERRGDRGRAMELYRGVVERNENQQTRAAVEAFRRLKQLEFGLPLDTAEGVTERRARRGGESP